MDHVSNSTMEYTTVAMEIAATMDLDIGEPMSRESNGDSTWFVLTNEPAFEHIFILLCHPHGMLVEYNIADDFRMGVVNDLPTLLEQIKNAGYRKLSSHELDQFTQGSS